MKDIAVTGRGIISPIGSTIAAFEAGLDAGTVPFRMAPWSNAEKGDIGWIAPVADFTPTEWMSDKVADGTGRAVQFGIAAAVQAVRESGLELDPLRTAVVVGTTAAGLDEIAQAQRAWDLEGVEAVPPKLTIRGYGFYCAAQVATAYGLHGPLMTLDHACAAGLDAIGHGARLIEMGDVDVVIAVGAGGKVPDVFRHSRFAPPRDREAIDMERATDPLRQCMPFDVRRINLVAAEGAAAVVLERCTQAEGRGARIFGTVRGFAAISDSYHATAPDPTGAYEALAMRRAQENAGVSPSAVDALIAHGTSTIKGDLAEIRAINTTFRERAAPLPVTSTKGQLGHMGGASGIASVLAAFHCMETGQFVPTANTVDVEPEAEFDVVTLEPKPVAIDVLQVNAFGFGGHDSSLVIGRGG